MGLFETAAAKALASSGVFLFMTVLLIAAAKRISTCIGLYSVQSLVITAQIIAVSRMHHSTEGFVIAAMVLTVKVVAIPYVLYRIVEALNGISIIVVPIAVGRFDKDHLRSSARRGRAKQRMIGTSEVAAENDRAVIRSHFDAHRRRSKDVTRGPESHLV